MTAIAVRLREVRETRDLTMREFAEAVGVSHGAVQGYEPGGKTDKIPADYVARVCDVFGISPAWLLFGREPMMDHPHDSELQRLQLVRAIVTVTEQVPDGTVSDWLEVVETIRARQRDEEARQAQSGGRIADAG